MSFSAFITDLHHFTRWITHRSNEGSALIYAIGHGIKRKKWYWYLADFNIMFSAKSIGFYDSYNIFSNNRQKNIQAISYWMYIAEY